MSLVRAVELLLAGCTLALAGCPTVDLGDTPPDIGLCNPKGGLDYFQNRMWPEYLNKMTTDCGPNKNLSCNCAQSSCHGNGSSAGGLGFGNPTDFPTNYRAAQTFLNCGTPDQSLLLTKPLAGVEGHGGQDLFTMSDDQYKVFMGWFQ